MAGASVLAGRAVAHVRHRCLAQRVLESDRACALEAGGLAGKLDNGAGATVLALEVARAARVQVLAVLPDIARRTPAISLSSPVKVTNACLFTGVWRAALKTSNISRPNSKQETKERHTARPPTHV